MCPWQSRLGEDPTNESATPDFPDCQLHRDPRPWSTPSGIDLQIRQTLKIPINAQGQQSMPCGWLTQSLEGNLRHGGPEISSLTGSETPEAMGKMGRLLYKCVKAEESSEYKTLHRSSPCLSTCLFCSTSSPQPRPVGSILGGITLYHGLVACQDAITLPLMPPKYLQSSEKDNSAWRGRQKSWDRGNVQPCSYHVPLSTQRHMLLKALAQEQRLDKARQTPLWDLILRYCNGNSIVPLDPSSNDVV